MMLSSWGEISRRIEGIVDSGEFVPNFAGAKKKFERAATAIPSTACMLMLKKLPWRNSVSPHSPPNCAAKNSHIHFSDKGFLSFFPKLGKAASASLFEQDLIHTRSAFPHNRNIFLFVPKTNKTGGRKRGKKSCVNTAFVYPYDEWMRGGGLLEHPPNTTPFLGGMGRSRRNFEGLEGIISGVSFLVGTQKREFFKKLFSPSPLWGRNCGRVHYVRRKKMALCECLYGGGGGKKEGNRHTC